MDKMQERTGQDETLALAKELEGLGLTNWNTKNALSYFSHSGGDVSLDAAQRFYDNAVRLAERAAKRLRSLVAAPAPVTVASPELLLKAASLISAGFRLRDADGRLLTDTDRIALQCYCELVLAVGSAPPSMKEAVAQAQRNGSIE